MKTFGISPVEVTAATGDELYISIDDGTATLLTIPAGDYLNMADRGRDPDADRCVP